MRYTVRFGDLAVPDPWAEEWNWLNAARPSRVCNAIRGTFHHGPDRPCEVCRLVAQQVYVLDGTAR
jgi:hypothetical protein